MAEDLFEGRTIKFPCPHCGQEITQTIGWITAHDRMDCPACGGGIGLKSEGLREGVQKANEAIDKFRESLRDLGRKC